MYFDRFRSLALVSVFSAAALTACAKPKAPTVVPKEVRVTALDLETVSLDMRVEMTNPNGFPITVQRVSGRVKIEGVDVGTVDVPHTVSLPPNAPTSVQVPLKVRWQGATQLATIAAQGRDIPFTVDGSVGVGSEKLSVDVPYTQNGVITQKQLQDAAIRSVQKQLLPLLQGR